MDYARRLAGLQKVMQEQDADLVVYGACPNYQYLTGMPVDWRTPPDHLPLGHDVFIPREGAPIATATSSSFPGNDVFSDIRVPSPGQSYADLVESIVVEFRGPKKKVGIGANLQGAAVLALLDAIPSAQYVDASRWLDKTRMIKEPEEIAKLRKVAALTDVVVAKAVGELKEGVSMFELSLEIEMLARMMGATGLSFGPFVGYMRSENGPSDDIANVGLHEGLQPNTAICFDIGFILDGYVSDWGRSVYWGKPAQHIVDAHTALRESMLEVVGTLHDGSMRACDVYPAIEKALDKRGFGDQMRLRLGSHKGIGHSIGVEVHEYPWLGPDFDEVLRENMVIAIEPKLWLPGEYYLRLEELVLVGKKQSEFLTNFDRELFVL